MNLLRNPLRQQIRITIGAGWSAHKFNVLCSVRRDNRRAHKELVRCINGTRDEQYMTPLRRWDPLKKEPQAVRGIRMPVDATGGSYKQA